MHVRQVIPKDAIPSVDDPAFGDEYGGEPDERVLVVGSDDGPARAYPIRYLNYHEIVNDRVDGDPLAVTWCPLCGSAVVYEREAAGRVLTFGVSGKLADDDLVMYDRETESEWKQSSGECIAGPLEGETLAVRPAGVVTYEAFRADYPSGVVLQPPGGESEAAGEGEEPAAIDYDLEPYRDYFASEGFGLAAHRGEGAEREWERDDLDPKAVVLGVEFGDEALGFPLERVRAAGGVVRQTVGGRDVVVFATESGGLHAFADPGYDFERADDEAATFAADGTSWDPASGTAADGRTLERLPARRLFAFAWQDDHGADAFWTGPRGG